MKIRMFKKGKLVGKPPPLRIEHDDHDWSWSDLLRPTPEPQVLEVKPEYL